MQEESKPVRKTSSPASPRYCHRCAAPVRVETRSQGRLAFCDNCLTDVQYGRIRQMLYFPTVLGTIVFVTLGLASWDSDADLSLIASGVVVSVPLIAVWVWLIQRVVRPRRSHKE